MQPLPRAPSPAPGQRAPPPPLPKNKQQQQEGRAQGYYPCAADSRGEATAANVGGPAASDGSELGGSQRSEVWGHGEVFELASALAVTAPPRPGGGGESARGAAASVAGAAAGEEGEEEGEEEGYESAHSSSVALSGSTTSLLSAQQGEAGLSGELPAPLEKQPARGGLEGAAPNFGKLEAQFGGSLKADVATSGRGGGEPGGAGGTWQISAGPRSAVDTKVEAQRAQRAAHDREGVGREQEREQEPPPSPAEQQQQAQQESRPRVPSVAGASATQGNLPDWLGVQQRGQQPQPQLQKGPAAPEGAPPSAISTEAAAAHSKEEARSPVGPAVGAAAQGTGGRTVAEPRAGTAGESSAAAPARPEREGVGSEAKASREAEAVEVLPAQGDSSSEPLPELHLLHRQHDIPPQLREAAVAVLSGTLDSPRASPLSSPRSGSHTTASPRRGLSPQQAAIVVRSRIVSGDSPRGSPRSGSMTAQQAQHGAGAPGAERSLHRLFSPRDREPPKPMPRALGPGADTQSGRQGLEGAPAGQAEIEAEAFAPGAAPGLQSPARKHSRQSSWEAPGAYGLPGSRGPGETSAVSPEVSEGGHVLPLPVSTVAGQVSEGGQPGASQGPEVVPLLAAWRRAMREVARTPSLERTSASSSILQPGRAGLGPLAQAASGPLPQQAQAQPGLPTAVGMAPGTEMAAPAAPTASRAAAPGIRPTGPTPRSATYRDTELGLQEPLLGWEGDESADDLAAEHAQQPADFWTGFALVVNAVLGVGVVAMPFAFMHLGLVGGTLVLAAAVLLAALSARLLLAIAHAAGVRSYSEAMRAVLGGWGAGLAEIVMVALCFGLLVAALAVTGDILVGPPGGLLADWLDRPTALTAFCVVVAAPLVTPRHPHSRAATAAVGMAAVSLWAVILAGLVVAAVAKGAVAGSRLWPTVHGLPWWQAALEVMGALPVLLLAAVPHASLLEGLTGPSAAATEHGWVGGTTLRGRAAGACFCAMAYSAAVLLVAGLCGFALFGGNAQPNVLSGWAPSSFEPLLGSALAVLCCAAARLAVAVSLLAGLPPLVAGARDCAWRLLFWQELRGAGRYLITYAVLGAGAYASLRLASSGLDLWRGLQLLGSTAGAVVVLVLPGLAVACGGGDRATGLSTGDRWLGVALALAGLAVAAGAAQLAL